MILAARSTREFEAEVRERVRERLTNGASDAAVACAKSALRTAKRRYELATRALVTVEGIDGSQDADDAIMLRIKESKSALRQAEHALDKAKRVTLSADAECDRISLVLERTHVLGNAFAFAEPEEKKLLLNAWIDGLLVVVEPVPGMPHANFKTAIVDLSTAPGLPEYFELQTGQGTLRSSAATSSERPGYVRAHERLLVCERHDQQLDVVGGAHVAQDHRCVAGESAALGPLHRRPAERGCVLLERHPEQPARQLQRVDAIDVWPGRECRFGGWFRECMVPRTHLLGDVSAKPFADPVSYRSANASGTTLCAVEPKGEVSGGGPRAGRLTRLRRRQTAWLGFRRRAGERPRMPQFATASPRDAAPLVGG